MKGLATGNALIVENDLKEALAQLAVIVDLTNKFEDIYSIRIHVVHQRTIQGFRFILHDAHFNRVAIKFILTKT